MIRNIYKNRFRLLTFLVVFLTKAVYGLTHPVFIKAAYGKLTNPALSDELQGLSAIEYFQRLIPLLVTVAFIIGSIIFFFLLLIGGIQWMTAGSDKVNLEAARGRLINAVIGLVILFSVFAIVGIIEIFFDVSILSLDIGALILP